MLGYWRKNRIHTELSTGASYQGKSMSAPFAMVPAYIVMLICFALSSALAAPPSSTMKQPGASVDSDGNIQFTFDNQASIRVAPISDKAVEACAPTSEGAIRYNTHASIKSLQVCDGIAWKGFGQSPELAATTAIYNNPPEARTIESGAFTNDGFIGGNIICNGGANRLRVEIYLNELRMAGAVGIDDPTTSTYEADVASFFSYIPKNIPWKVVTTSNVGGNCTVRITKYGS